MLIKVETEQCFLLKDTAIQSVLHQSFLELGVDYWVIMRGVNATNSSGLDSADLWAEQYEFQNKEWSQL